ncbi:hypothetical protein BLNAU_12075 [Blattamonas nauphoetae]|uniref:Uncharacterized protein n=1 Tax=Blattamonas nauphoetae TaxID=2049346 RepID=A0ABQ9XM07_9EUKA|nr:hypothetical protein BLNAU_12075 [Blattamonas nauphoetae]
MTPLPNREGAAIAGRRTCQHKSAFKYERPLLRLHKSHPFFPFHTSTHQPQHPVRCHPTHADITDNVIVASTSTVITGRTTNTMLSHSFMPAVSRNHLPSSLKSEQSRADSASGVGRAIPKVVSRQLAHIRR